MADVTRLLLVEDERGQAVLLQDELARAAPGQFQLAWAQSLAAALEEIGRAPFDAVLLDLSLPDSRGLETVERVAAASRSAAIVVLTGQADERVAIEALRAGAQDYLVKDEAGGRSIARAVRYSIERRQAREARERSEQLRQMASAQTLAEQRERQRLAQLIHDGLQQLLVGAGYRLGRLERVADPETRQVAAEVGQLLSEAIAASRTLTAELGPPILRAGGLVPALEWLVRWMQDKHGLEVSLEAHGNVEPEVEDLTVFLFQAVRELLFNVAKHAGTKGAAVEVVREDSRVRVVVSDQGVGFDPALLRPSGGDRGGFGLFSISERLQLLGGRMEIASSPGTGSRFVLVAPLPVRAEEPAAAPEPKVSVAMPARPTGGRLRRAGAIRVMLVDDHAVMRQGLAALLREEPDFDIVGEASDGRSAVELARELRPDVVLMDINMPGMNGIEATRVIHAELPGVKVVGLSMFEEAEQAAAMRAAGAVHYLAKSGPSGAVVAAIRACAAPAGG